MINPVIVEDSLRVFFPTSDDGGNSHGSGASVSFATINHSDTVSHVEVMNLVSRHVRVMEDVSDVKSMFRRSSVHNDVTYCGDYVGLRDLGFSNPAIMVSSGRIRSTRAALLDARWSGLVRSVDVGLDSAETQAELHLFKMRTFEATESRRRALDYMYDFLEDAFDRRDTRMIDHMLLLASRDLIGHSLSVSFLRATSRARKYLSFWRFFSSKVRDSLRDHPHANKLLKGLD